MESLYYFEFCVVILSCCLKIRKLKNKKIKKKKKNRICLQLINILCFWIPSR